MIRLAGVLMCLFGRHSWWAAARGWHCRRCPAFIPELPLPIPEDALVARMLEEDERRATAAHSGQHHPCHPIYGGIG